MWDRTRSGNAPGTAVTEPFYARRQDLGSNTTRYGGGHAMPATVERRTSRLAPVHRVARGIDRRTVVRIGIVAVACYAAWLAIEAFGRPYNFFDLLIYHGAVVWWAGGGDLYAFIAPDTTLGFTYPPFAALVMLPMAALSDRRSPAGSTSSPAWPRSPWSSPRCSARSPTATAGPAGSPWRSPLPLATAIEPVRETLGYGQVNLLLFALIMADLVALRWRARGGAAGAARRRAGRPVRGAAAPGPASASAWPPRSS